ncbi:GMC family oxidoreductase [Bradyrhizobium sp. 23AC]
MLKWFITGRGAATTTLAQVTTFCRSAAELERVDMQIVMRPLSFTLHPGGVVTIDDDPGITASALQCRPYSRGRVRIESADPRKRGRIESNHLADPRDVGVILAGLDRIRDIMSQSKISSRVTGEKEPGPSRRSREDMEQYLRTTAGTCYHLAGTCRMGADDDAVVDPALRVRGVEQLRVIDASIMPMISSGNTNAPTIMIAEKGADMLLAG